MTSSRLRELIDIEDLLHWAVAREYANIHAEQSGLFEGEAAAAGRPLRKISGDGCAGLARIAGLGCRPDGGIGMAGGHCHPDAETAYIAARRAIGDNEVFVLVMSHAKRGSRPGFGAHIPMFDVRPRLTFDMKPMILRAGGKWEYCVLQCVEVGDGPLGTGVAYPCRNLDIEHARREYLLWWGSLARIGALLRSEGKLIRYAPSGPRAPQFPWQRGGGDADRIGEKR